MEQRVARLSFLVAQIFNLLYRRLAVCQASVNLLLVAGSSTRARFLVAQIFNLPYRRLAVCRVLVISKAWK